MSRNSPISSVHGYGTLPLIVAGCLVVGMASPATAQDTRSSILEEIIVTAQKREQSLQDIGIAVTAFTGEQMEAFGVEASFDIASFTPGVHISGNLAGQNTQFTIRGVTQNDFNDIVEAPNAVYLDEGYLAVAQSQTFAVFDIDRVEILKGPQSTLFGRNATGGLIHYISKKPSFEEAEGYLDLTFGRYDSPAHANQMRAEGAVGGPLTETVAARIAFMYNWNDGYLKNLYPDGAFGGSPGPGDGADLGGDNTLAGRATFLFKASDTVNISLSFNAARSKLPTGPYQSKATIAVFDNNDELVNVIDVAAGETRASIAGDGSDFGTDLDNDGVFGLADPDDAWFPGRFGAGTDFFGYVDPDGDDFTFSGDFAFKNSGSIDTLGANLRIEWDVSDDMTLTSITDYKDYEKLLFIDVDSAPVNQAANYAGLDATSFTQELRLNGETETMRWVAGLYYLNIDSESDNGLKFPIGSIVPGAPFEVGSDAHLKTDSYSIFGQVEYDLSEQLTLIVGGRYIREKKDYDFTQNFYFESGDSRQVHQGGSFVIGPVYDNGFPEPYANQTSDGLWAGKIQIDYHVNDDLLLYAGVNRGVKAGSFNAHLNGGLAIPTSAIAYDEEVLISYEGGFKSTHRDGRIRINGSFFYYDYKDYQAFLFTGVSGVVINNDAENIGAELDIQTSPSEGLDMILGVSWFDAKVKDVPLRVGGPISRDVDPTYAPEFQVNGMIRYEIPAFEGRLSFMGDFAYSDEYFYNLRNFDADKFNDYLVFNAQIAWISETERVELALKIKNITDERVGVQGFDLATLCGCNEISYRPPRWYGLSLKYRL